MELERKEQGFLLCVWREMRGEVSRGPFIVPQTIST